MVLLLDLWNFQAPSYWNWKLFSFTQRQYNWTAFSHGCVLCWLFFMRGASLLKLYLQKWKEQEESKLLDSTSMTEPINHSLASAYDTTPEKGHSPVPSQSWGGSINTDISEYSMGIKHLIFDTCTELNLPDPQNPPLAHKSQWNQSVILLISPCHDNHTGDYLVPCFPPHLSG